MKSMNISQQQFFVNKTTADVAKLPSSEEFVHRQENFDLRDISYCICFD